MDLGGHCLGSGGHCFGLERVLPCFRAGRRFFKLCGDGLMRKPVESWPTRPEGGKATCMVAVALTRELNNPRTKEC